jgi:hypothetical protein
MECPLQTDVTVARISDQDTEFLNYITESGLNPGVTLRVKARSERAESVELDLVGREHSLTLGKGAALKILVRL